METATKAPQGVRPSDKVLQALASLAALIDSTIREVKSLDSEFQSRLLQAVHDTEASLQAQTEQHVERVRKEVQEELNSLKSELETEREKARENVSKAVHDTEVLLKAQTAEHVEHARLEAQEELQAKYQKDLQSTLDSMKSEFEVERERLNDVAEKLEAERSGLVAELQELKTNSAAEIEKARADAKAAAARQPAPAAAAASAPPASLQQEIARAEAKLQEILKLIDNPTTELSTVIRKNVEKSEVEAYLKGIHLVLDAKS